jgi:hypothetical protein
MTISTTINRKEYTGNGVNDTFPYTFWISVDGDLKVYVDSVLQTITTHYTVTNAGEPTGGNVVFTAGNIPVNNASVVIWRDVPKTQSTDYVGGEKFSAETHHETALDRLTVITQQLQDDMDRCIKLAKTVTDAGNVEMDVTAAERATKYFGFDANGELLISASLGTWKGKWATTTAYVIGDMIYDGDNGADTDNVYYCTTAHTSGTWATDLSAAKWTIAIDMETIATDAAASAAAAAASAADAASDAADTAADLVLTNADVVLTGLDVDATNADVVSTNADAASTASDAVDTAADLVLTNADVVLANKWAEEAEDVEVAAGEYSALHWAAKAAADNPADAIHKSVASEIHGITAKGTLVGADEFLIEDSAASWVKKRATLTALLTLAGSFPSGTKMYFYQASAPTGWTIDNTLGDRLLAVHGTSAYASSTGGGEQKGSWTISGFSNHATHTAHTDHPAHNHLYMGYGLGGVNRDSAQSGSYNHYNSAGTQIPYTNSQSLYTANLAAQSHSAHSAHDAHSQDGNWRPAANVGIIATRD